MKLFRKISFSMLLIILLAGCTNSGAQKELSYDNIPHADIDYENLTGIVLSDEGITVDGKVATEDSDAAVSVAKDIVFYLEGQGFTYGEGSEADEHSQEEADAHTVVHINKPGTYTISGQLSAGQIAIDLGEEAKDDPEAVVNLILNGADIHCSVAPAIIFYNVYECGDSDAENASKDVNTSEAGANVIIADGSKNTINGAYVARIYESVELNEAGTEVVDSKKLHKYDSALYSKMSMNVFGEDEGDGELNIIASNEGLDSELLLTVNGGNINIESGNDGINTNEDEVSVTTINGGRLNILVNGATGEGDGIDSNGWLVINGGTLISQACSTSGDAGIDSDMGIHINGGTVLAGGNMLDRISESAQTYAVFQFMQAQKGENSYVLKNTEGIKVAEYNPKNDFSCWIVSSPELAEGTYSLWRGDEQLAVSSGKMPGGPGEEKPEGEMPPGEKPKGEMPQGEKPQGERPEMPQGEKTEKPEGELPPEQRGDKIFNMFDAANATKEVVVATGANYYMVTE